MLPQMEYEADEEETTEQAVERIIPTHNSVLDPEIFVSLVDNTDRRYNGCCGPATIRSRLKFAMQKLGRQHPPLPSLADIRQLAVDILTGRRPFTPGLAQQLDTHLLVSDRPPHR